MSDLPLLIGEAPSKSGDRYYMFPLSGAVAETLCKLAGIPPQPGAIAQPGLILLELARRLP